MFGGFGRRGRHRHGHRHGHHGWSGQDDPRGAFDPAELGEHAAKLFAAFGPFGGRGRRGGFGMGLGRKIGSADLQVVVLSLLAEKPSYGYELIKALEEKTGGFYVPSPGMIYPALTFLEDLGYATVETEGSRKRYSITEEGRAHLELNRASLDSIMEAFSHIGSRMDDVRRAMGADEEDGNLRREIHAARHALRAALQGKRRCSAAEAKRIAAILERAAREIADGPQVEAATASE